MRRDSHSAGGAATKVRRAHDSPEESDQSEQNVGSDRHTPEDDGAVGQATEKVCDEAHRSGARRRVLRVDVRPEDPIAYHPDQQGEHDKPTSEGDPENDQLPPDDTHRIRGARGRVRVLG